MNQALRFRLSDFEFVFDFILLNHQHLCFSTSSAGPSPLSPGSPSQALRTHS